MQRIFLRLLPLFALVGLFFLPACSVNQSSSSDATPTAIPTPIIASKPTYTVTKGDISSILEVSGRVVPFTEQQAFFKTDGRIRKVYVKTGDSVTKGQVMADLLILDDLQRDQEQQDINQRRAEINLSIAKLHALLVATQTPLYAPNRAEQMAINNYQLQLAQLDYDEQTLHSSNVQASIEEAQLVAPIDGQVLGLAIEEGDPVKAYDAVALVGDLKNLEVGADLTDPQMQQLTEGKDCIASFSNRPGDEFACKIRSMPYPYGTAAKVKDTGTTTTSLLVDNSNTRFSITLKPDQSLRLADMLTVKIILQEKKAVLLLPISAVRTFEGRNFVVVKTDAAQKRVDIKTGLQNGDLVEIQSGLEEGQVVVAP